MHYTRDITCPKCGTTFNTNKVLFFHCPSCKLSCGDSNLWVYGKIKQIEPCKKCLELETDTDYREGYNAGCDR